MPRKKKAAPVHVVRQWTSSPVIYGPLRGKTNEDVSPNPNYHPTIGLTSEGMFVDEVNRPVDPKLVPDYIRAEARTTDLNIVYQAPRRRDLSLRSAMVAAGVEDTDPDDAARHGVRPTKAVYA